MPDNNNQTEGKKEEPKRIGPLENLVDESLYGIKTFCNLGLAVAMPLSLASAVPSAATNIGILAGAQVATDFTTNHSIGKKTNSTELLKASAIGTTMALPIHYAFNLLNEIPLDTIGGYIGRAAALGVVAYPIITAAYGSVDYLIRNITFRGMGKHLKEHYWNILKKAWAYVFPLSLINIFFVPLQFQVLVAAGLTYVYDKLASHKKSELKDEEKRDKTPYLVVFSNLASKSYNGIMDGFYNLGVAVNKSFESLPESTPTPAAQPS